MVKSVTYVLTEPCANLLKYPDRVLGCVLKLLTEEKAGHGEKQEG